jgi:hypothetical protein
MNTSADPFCTKRTAREKRWRKSEVQKMWSYDCKERAKSKIIIYPSQLLLIVSPHALPEREVISLIHGLIP